MLRLKDIGEKIHLKFYSLFHLCKIFSALGEVGKRKQEEIKESIRRERSRTYSYDRH